MDCPKCKTILFENSSAKFCIDCGRPVSKEGQNKSSTQPTPSTTHSVVSPTPQLGKPQAKTTASPQHFNRPLSPGGPNFTIPKKTNNSNTSSPNTTPSSVSSKTNNNNVNNNNSTQSPSSQTSPDRLKFENKRSPIYISKDENDTFLGQVSDLSSKGTPPSSGTKNEPVKSATPTGTTQTPTSPPRNNVSPHKKSNSDVGQLSPKKEPLKEIKEFKDLTKEINIIPERRATLKDISHDSWPSTPVLDPLSSEIREREKKSKKDKKKKKKKFKVFGVPLADLIQLEDRGVNIPIIVERAVNYFFINEESLDQEGIFRISPSLPKLQELCKLIDEGKEYDLSPENSHMVASVLKKYLRELPDALLSCELYDCFIAIWEVQEESAKLKKLKDIVDMLPRVNRDLVEYLLDFLAKVGARSQHNKMTLQNLSTIFGPILLRTGSQIEEMISETTTTCKISQSMIENRRQLFPQKINQ